jgi:hypothetical protein
MSRPYRMPVCLSARIRSSNGSQDLARVIKVILEVSDPRRLIRNRSRSEASAARLVHSPMGNASNTRTPADRGAEGACSLGLRPFNTARHLSTSSWPPFSWHWSQRSGRIFGCRRAGLRFRNRCILLDRMPFELRVSASSIRSGILLRPSDCKGVESLLQALHRLHLDLAHRLLERQPLTGDLGLWQRRFHVT